MIRKIYLRELMPLAVMLTLCTAVGFSQTRAGQDAAEPERKRLPEVVSQSLSKWLAENLEDRGVPGAAWSIVTTDRVVAQQTRGYTDLSGAQPIEEDTIFCIRSVTKSFTALAVLIAVQQGILDLDKPISHYLPDFSINSRFDDHPEDLITIRHMLAHWAGFAHDPPYGIDAGSSDYFQNYIDRISETWLRFPVGYRYEYSNYGYDLAAYILERESGMSLAAFIAAEIFESLGMSDSTFDLDVARQSENRAIGHKGERQLPVKFPETGSGGVYSSIRDMAKYAAFHLNGGMVNGRRLLSKELMRQYHAIQFPREGQKTGYTLGLIREPVGKTFSLYHEGGGRGYGSHLMLYPETGIAAVLLTNREYNGLTGFSGRQRMNEPLHEVYGANVADEPDTDSFEPVAGNDARLLSILGRYGDSPGVTVEIDEEQLVFRYGTTERHAASFFDDGGELVAFYGDVMEVRFLDPYDGHPGSMMIVNRTVGNSNSHYHDYNDSPDDPAGPDRLQWVPLTGLYDVLWEDDPLSTAEVEVRNGYLYFRDGKCKELEAGLFQCYDGEALDFTTDPPTYANSRLAKRAPTTIYLVGN